MSDRCDVVLSCATCRCCRASAPTAPTRCAPTSTPRWPAGRMPLLLRVDSRNQVLISDGRVVLGKAARAGRQARRPRGVPRPDDGRQARVGGPQRAGGARRIPTPRPRCSTCAGPGTIFDDVSAQLVATATALLNWHDSARFSAVDGSPTKPIKAGWSRVNPVNGHEEFPRIDPAVICLVHDGHDRAVLARQTRVARAAVLAAGRIRRGRRVVRGVRACARSPRRSA